MAAEKGTEVNLRIPEPVPRGSYTKIVWYRNTSSMDHSRIAVYNESLHNSKLQYFESYCSHTNSCLMSNKAELNITSGDLNIYSAELSDSGIYYYKFDAADKEVSDSGHKYEILLEVYSE